jgi:hypothetical protein
VFPNDLLRTFNVGAVEKQMIGSKLIPHGNTNPATRETQCRLNQCYVSGSGAGPYFNLSGQSTLNTGAGGFNYLPGNSDGTLIQSSVYLPPIPPASVTGATGLGVGGSAIINPVYGADSHAGSVKLTAGSSGTAATGLVTVNYQTAENKMCLATATAGFPAGSVITLVSNVANLAIQFSWTAPGALTANASYYFNYLCNSDF